MQPTYILQAQNVQTKNIFYALKFGTEMRERLYKIEDFTRA